MLIATHEIETDTGNEAIYNGLDCCLTHEIFSTLSAQMPAAAPAYGFELALQAPVLEMMLRGFRIDAGAWEMATAATRQKLGHLSGIIDKVSAAIWGRPLNPNSGMQLKEMFYGHLGVEEILTYDKGELKSKMDREVLEQISDYFQARFIATAVLAHRDLTKQLQVLETEIDPDWRMRTSYNIGGTNEGRFSSSFSPTGTGGNLQNIAGFLRHIFVADPGYVLVGIDAEQSDSRMVGYMCGLLFNDWTYLDACESGDLHTFVARLAWPNLPWTGDLKKDRAIAEAPFYRHFTLRDMCKRLGHGVNFLGKAPTMARFTHMPVELVRTFIQRYLAAFPALSMWHAWTAGELQTHRQLTSIHGRKRDFFDRSQDDATIRKALAFLAAAATADNINLGLWKIWRYMPEVQLLAQVHDAVYFQFPASLDVNVVVPKAQKLLELPLTAPNGRRFVVPTEAKYGYNWGNYEPPDKATGRPEQNPQGLRKFKLAA